MKEALVALHLPKDAPPDPHMDGSLADWGHAELAVALQERDVQPVFSHEATPFNWNDRTGSMFLPTNIKREDGRWGVRFRTVIMDLDEVGAFRSFTRSAIGNEVPEINVPAVRAIASDKAAANRLLGTLGLAKPYVELFDGSPEDVLDELDAEEVVLKPSAGQHSEGIQIITKEQLRERIRNQDLGGERYVAEERLLFDYPFPGVVGETARDQLSIDSANELCLPKELRFYTFGRDQHGALIGNFVMRSTPSGESHFINDDWVFVDQASVPLEVTELSDTIATAFEEETGVDEMHLAIDWTYAATTRDSAPTWLPMEVNANQPQLVYDHENPGLAQEQAGFLADQLVRLAQQGE